MRLSDDVLRAYPGDVLDLEWRGPDPHVEVVADDDPLAEITALWVDDNESICFIGAELALDLVEQA